MSRKFCNYIDTNNDNNSYYRNFNRDIFFISILESIFFIDVDKRIDCNC